MSTKQAVGSGGSNAPGGASKEDFDRDLHGENRAGQHGGSHDIRTYSAYDVKHLHEKLSDYTNDELKRITILAHGERLEQGGIYLDLSEDSREPFVAHGGLETQDPHLYVPKALQDYELWNRLTGVEH